MGKKGTSGGAPAAPPLVVNKRSGVVSQPQPVTNKRAAPEPEADAAEGGGGGGDFDLDSLFKKGKAGKKVKDAEAAAEVGALPRWSPVLLNMEPGIAVVAVFAARSYSHYPHT